MCLTGITDYRESGYIIFGGMAVIGALMLGITTYNNLTSEAINHYFNKMYITSAVVLGLGLIGLGVMHRDAKRDNKTNQYAKRHFSPVL